ncbi:uncharacterized protein LOC119072774 [Bradysia coprophila]|uniref:uncharacterized protein LOC119072774 n=1 Tax=Bradysia coprophila TaxID=38358 RepID=UPI00187D96C8|nr:uncharacterized protein LOC119072774 [Bradysia coprophila]
METKIEYEISTDLDLENLPSNYTLFVHELQRIAFGREKSNYQHGMSPDEYERFVNDMWIGIVLTMLMVIIVFSLCTWYMYHKFQQWKRHHDARLRMPNSTPGGLGSDIECLPNYTLVSGLPTYDDALEQIRLRSTNHLLINHQTIMKMFGSIKDKPKKQKPDIPVPTYEDSIRSQPHSTTDGSADLNFSQSSLLSNTNAASHRFKCSIVVDPPEQSDQMNGEQSSNHNPVFISNSLGSLNISKEIEKSRPEIKWSPHSHRSSSLCIGLENFAFQGHQRHLEHRGSLC